MIRARVQYAVKERKSFENKVLPYVFGGGIFSQETEEECLWKHNNLFLTLKVKTLSQLITATTGMLRYSPACILENIEILKSHKVLPLRDPRLALNRPLLGVLLKPSLTYHPTTIKQLITSSVKNKIDFVKDDDVSEYSQAEATQIKELCDDVPYFQKVTNPLSCVSNYAMLVPWIDGWPLLEETSKKKTSLSHCANLSPQIAWPAHILFSRLAGATLIVVPDPLFDTQFKLTTALTAATTTIKGVPSARLSISGGINPTRIRTILKKTNKKSHNHLGFTVGSWLLPPNTIAKKLELLKKAIIT